MEPKVLLPYLKEPATCPCHEPVQSSPRPNLTSWRAILRLSFHLRLVLPSGLLLSGLPTQILYAPLLSPYVLHAPPISFFSIW
jgi:hypothetical protein